MPDFAEILVERQRSGVTLAPLQVRYAKATLTQRGLDTVKRSWY